MKGIVFTEFLDMVESEFGLEVADKVILESEVPNQGSYIAVGTYHHSEMVSLVIKLSENTGIAIPDLLKAFGKYLFGRFVKGFPQFFLGIDSAFKFLLTIENNIHVEVKKLYPDAELPSFDTFLEEDKLVMIYNSERGLADLAEGLILGCKSYYNEEITIERIDLMGGSGKNVKFILSK